MRMWFVWRGFGLCLVAAVSAQGTLIDFTSRAAFAAGTVLQSNLPDSNGVDFSNTTTECPTTATSNGDTGCSNTGTFGGFASSAAAPLTTPKVVNFANLGISGFSVEGYFGSTTNQTRLSLYSSNYDHPTWGALKFAVPIMSTRNLSDNANTAALKVRINLPANVNSFAIDLSNACNINTGSTGCDPTDNHMGTILVTTSNGDTKIVNTTDPSQSVGELTTYAAQTDANITWIELSLPALDQAGNANVGSIAFTRIAFGQAQTPEPATFLLAAAGLALLLRCRKR